MSITKLHRNSFILFSFTLFLVYTVGTPLQTKSPNVSFFSEPTKQSFTIEPFVISDRNHSVYNLNGFRKTFDSCRVRTDFLMCLKSKMVIFLNNAPISNNISLAGGSVILAREKLNSSSYGTGRSLPMTEHDLEIHLPQDPASRSSRLNLLLAESLTRLLKSYVVKMKIPGDAFDSMKRSVNEARGGKGGGGGFGGFGSKKKGGGGMDPNVYVLDPSSNGNGFSMIMMMKGMLVTLALGTLALLAGKALMLSLVSIVISAIIGIKKLASGNSGETKIEVIKYPSTEYHGRKTLEDDYGHNLAYGGYFTR